MMPASMSVDFKNVPLVILFVFSGLIVNAQKKEQNIGDEQVVIEKGYKPAVADAVKAASAPVRDTIAFVAPAFQYNPEPVPVRTDFILPQVKPVKIKDDKIDELYRGYIKGGYGTQATPYGELYYNALRSKEFNAGVHLKHLSSKGKISGYGSPDNSHNYAELFGRKYFESAVLGTEFIYDRNVYHYYGYDAETQILSKDQTKTLLNNFSGKFFYQSTGMADEELRYKFSVPYYYVRDDFENKEGNFGVNAWMGKKFGSGTIHGNILVDITKLQQSYGNTTNNVFSIEPRYLLKYQPWEIDAGIDSDIEFVNDSSVLHLYPYFRFSYQLGSNASAYGSFGGGLQKNSFRSLYYDNPFLSEVFGIGNTNNKIDLHFGLNFNFDQHFFVNGEVAYRQFENEIFFLNTSRKVFIDTIGYPVTAFSPSYLDGNELKFHAEIGYHKTQKLEVKVMADFYGYNLENDAEPFHTPPVVIGLNANYNLGQKLILTADLFIHGQRKYYDFDNQATGTLSSITDFNLGVEYRYSKLLSFYANLNNVAFQKYRVWYNYPSYKFNAIAGFSYSF